MHARCPHCQNPIELVHDAELSRIDCPSCGSSFSLLGDETVSHQITVTESIGHFQLVEKVGVGAFGTVWKAHDPKLDRTVAIKIPRKDQLDTTETEQFLREARSAAQLKHPSIVAVHEVGRQGSQPYIVSDFVDGLSLSSWLSGKRPTIRESLELCVRIADALAHAHNKGVIHRDLKPSNIMLDANGNPHIMDFGLAKRDAGEITMTLDGKVLGTPAYMSPEQARGQSHTADGRSDLYSLGVILFELLTGERPFRGDYRMLIHQVLHDEPPSPRRLKTNLPRDIETICLKCLDKEPDRRYSSANALAEDLQRWLDQKPIKAKRVGTAERLIKLVKRNPTISCLVASLVLAILIGFGATVRQLWQTELARREAETARNAAIESRDKFRAAVGRTQAERFVARKIGLPPQQGSQSIVSESLEEYSTYDQLRIGKCDDSISCMSVFHDEAILAGTLNGELRLWRLSQTEGRPKLDRMANEVISAKLSAFEVEGELVWHEDAVLDATWSESGKKIVSVSRDQTIISWNETSWHRRKIQSFDVEKISCAKFSPDGNKLLIGDRSGTVYLSDLNGEVPPIQIGVGGALWSTVRHLLRSQRSPGIPMSPRAGITADERSNLYAGRGKTDTSTNPVQLNRLAARNETAISQLAWIDKGNRFTFVETAPTAEIGLLSLDGKEELLHRMEHPKQVSCIVMNMDNQLLLVANESGLSTLYSLNQASFVEIEFREKMITSATFGSNSELFLGCADGDIIGWDYDADRAGRVAVMSGPVTCLHFVENEMWSGFLSGTTNGTISLFYKLNSEKSPIHDEPILRGRRLGQSSGEG